jgi:predicted pyridoxine 5'-phosphate oxidase superfamily flavin-nucleotide-binding protein
MGILTEEMKRVVREQRLGFVATVCPDGTPNLSPKGTMDVWDDNHLVFADINSARTIANLQHNPVVETNVVDSFVRKGYRFRGKAIVLTEGELFDDVIAFYQEHDVFDAPKRIRTVVLVKVDRVLPLISPGYDREVTEEQVREKWKKYYLGLRDK